MQIGYARVSTKEQSFDLQVDALRKAGCEKVYAKRSRVEVPLRFGS